MTTTRRRFLQTLAASAAGVALAPASVLAAPASAAARLVILHTNDTHSRLDPFPDDGGRYAGLGGVARRARLVERVRQEHEHVLLLDSGDIFQGTPYFNLFGGEPEFRAMSAMRYDAATLGNHDFDNGVEGLVEMLPHAAFPFVSANYDVSAAPEALRERVAPYLIRQMGPVRVGIFGLGIAFERLVLPALHRGVTTATRSRWPGRPYRSSGGRGATSRSPSPTSATATARTGSRTPCWRPRSRASTSSSAATRTPSSRPPRPSLTTTTAPPSSTRWGSRGSGSGGWTWRSTGPGG
jgi:hypothetical protein